MDIGEGGFEGYENSPREMGTKGSPQKTFIGAKWIV